jgi:hypothetical protein
MAVYQGARPYAVVVPRRRQPSRARARQGSSSIGLSLAGILVCFLLALFYLTQMVHMAATGYDIDALVIERNRLDQELQSLQGDIARWGAEPQILGEAQEIGLGDLGNPVRLPAR